MLLALNLLAYFVIMVAASLRITALDWRTASWVEAALWWWLAVSAFAGLALMERSPGWQQVTLALSGAGLLVYHTQSIWRPWLADRRQGMRRGIRARQRASLNPIDDH